MTLLPHLANLLAPRFPSLSLDHRGEALYLEHLGRQFVVVAIDITEQVDVVAKALEVAHRVVKGGPEA